MAHNSENHPNAGQGFHAWKWRTGTLGLYRDNGKENGNYFIGLTISNGEVYLLSSFNESLVPGRSVPMYSWYPVPNAGNASRII